MLWGSAFFQDSKITRTQCLRPRLWCSLGHRTPLIPPRQPLPKMQFLVCPRRGAGRRRRRRRSHISKSLFEKSLLLLLDSWLIGTKSGEIFFELVRFSLCVVLRAMGEKMEKLKLRCNIHERVQRQRWLPPHINLWQGRKRQRRLRTLMIPPTFLWLFVSWKIAVEYVTRLGYSQTISPT